MGIRNANNVKIIRRETSSTVPATTHKIRLPKGSPDDYAFPDNIAKLPFGSEKMLYAMHDKYFQKNTVHHWVRFINRHFNDFSTSGEFRDLDGVNFDQRYFVELQKIVHDIIKELRGIPGVKAKRMVDYSNNGDASGNIFFNFGEYNMELSTITSKEYGDNVSLKINSSTRQIAQLDISPDAAPLIWRSSSTEDGSDKKICELLFWSVLNGNRFLKEFVRQSFQ